MKSGLGEQRTGPADGLGEADPRLAVDTRRPATADDGDEGRGRRAVEGA